MSSDYLDVFPDGLVLTSLFWDCECKENFIHPKLQQNCPICGAIRNEQPDSRANEVLLLCSDWLTKTQLKDFKDSLKKARYPRVEKSHAP